MRHMRRLRRSAPLRLAAVSVAVASALVFAQPAAATAGREHCASHAGHSQGTAPSVAASGAQHAAHDASRPSDATGPAGATMSAATECPHCPAPVCIRHATCAGTSGTAILAAAPRGVTPQGRNTAGAVWQPANSLTRRPPTPPPHTLL